MRVLFCMGEKSADGRAFVRPSARCIAIEGDRVAMVHSLQYDYYKFPGGGIEPQETREQAQEQFTLEWVQPKRAIEVNRTVEHGPKNQNMLEREARVLEILQQEGYFSTKE